MVGFAFILPGVALWNGGSGLAHGEINIRGADVTGLSARLYALGMICFGIGSLALPRFHKEYSTLQATRLLGGMILFLLAGTIALVF